MGSEDSEGSLGSEGSEGSLGSEGSFGRDGLHQLELVFFTGGSFLDAVGPQRPSSSATACL